MVVWSCSAGETGFARRREEREEAACGGWVSWRFGCWGGSEVGGSLGVFGPVTVIPAVKLTNVVDAVVGGN